MTSGAPYRESDAVGLVERACPACGAPVLYEARQTSASCAACDTRFATSVEVLTKSEPRQHPPDGEPAPLPLSPSQIQAENEAERAAKAMALVEQRARTRAEIANTLSVMTIIGIVAVGAAAGIAAGGVACLIGVSALSAAKWWNDAGKRRSAR